MTLRVTFLPDGKSADVPEGTSIVDASIGAGVRLIAPCNGKGTCGKCGVQFQEGVPAPVPADTCFYQEAELAEGWRLACMHGVEARSVVFVTPAALGKVDFGPSMEGIVVHPAVRKIYVPVGATAGDILTWPDITSYARDPLNEPPQLETLKALRELNPTAGTELTIIVRGGKAARIEEGDTRLENYGLALDIGTTTVAASLLDLNTGEEIASHSALNRQSVHGSDVMSRLTSLIENPSILPVLQRLAAETVGELLEQIVAETGIKRDRVHEVVVVGNSCMHHVFLGLDPMSLAFAPYSALVLSSGRGARFGSRSGPASGYAGLCPAQHREFHRGRRSRGYSCGGTASIRDHQVSGGYRDERRDHSGLAGPDHRMLDSGRSGLRRRLDQLRHDRERGRHPPGAAGGDGHAGNHWRRETQGAGRLRTDRNLRRAATSRTAQPAREIRLRQSLPSLSRSLADRMVDGGKSFLMARSYGKDLCLTQRDVRELQLAKGVIFAGIEALKIELGIGDDEIDELYLAGTFGSYLSVPSARTIGLVPRLPAERIRAVGNAAMVGAKMCLLSLEARAEAEELARRIEHVELPLRKDFQDIFMEAMLFPPVEGEEEHSG